VGGQPEQAGTFGFSQKFNGPSWAKCTSARMPQAYGGDKKGTFQRKQRSKERRDENVCSTPGQHKDHWEANRNQTVRQGKVIIVGTGTSVGVKRARRGKAELKGNFSLNRRRRNELVVSKSVEMVIKIKYPEILPSQVSRLCDEGRCIFYG